MIGSGLSRWAGYPLWNELLKELAKSRGSNLESEIDFLLCNNQYEEVASRLEKELSSNGFLNKLQRRFSPSLIEKHEPPEYLKMFPKLFTRPIITTNFDQVIEYLLIQPMEMLQTNLILIYLCLKFLKKF